MTCLEMLKKAHPGWTEKDLRNTVRRDCPHTFNIMGDPIWCLEEDGDDRCERCWNREVHREPPVSDKSYNPIQKAYDLMVGFCHEGKTTDLEEVIGYLGEALDEHPEDSIEGVISIGLHTGPIPEVTDGMGHNDPVGEPGTPSVDEIPCIKDSGDRTQFESGAVRDMREGKGRCDLMPLEVVARVFSDPVLNPDGYDINLSDIRKFQETNKTCYLYYVLRRFAQEAFDNFETMLLEVAKHFEEGAKKYGESNWQRGIPTKCYIDSATRHYIKWRRGDIDEPHDRAFCWNLMCCIWEVDYHKKEDVS